MQTERMTMAQALVKFLNQQYISVDGVETPFVEGVATIFGHGNVLGIGQALEQDPGHLQVMQGCNEQGIAHMATGFAKQHRRQRIFAVTSSVGPGAANMVTAAATAVLPLRFFTGVMASAMAAATSAVAMTVATAGFTVGRLKFAVFKLGYGLVHSQGVNPIDLDALTGQRAQNRPVDAAA